MAIIRDTNYKRIQELTNYGNVFYPKTITDAVWDLKRRKSLSEIIDGWGGGGTNVMWGVQSNDYIPLDVAGDSKTLALQGHRHSWVDIDNIPTMFNPSPHTHEWADISNKPNTFTPSGHTHNASDINSGILNILRIPTGITSTTVALGNHTHMYDQITNKPVLGSLSAKDNIEVSDISATGTPSGGTFLSGDGSWKAVESGGGANWGNIGGSLSDQTDLQTALNAKLNAINQDTNTALVNTGPYGRAQGSILFTESNSPNSLVKRDGNGRFEIGEGINNNHAVRLSQMNAALGTKANIQDIPTKVSDLDNDENYIKNSVDNLLNYYLKSQTYTRQEVQDLISAITSMQILAVSELPAEGEPNIIYLVPKPDSEIPDVKDEYIWIGNWELIGSTAVNLSWENILNKPVWIGENKPTYSINEITGLTSALEGKAAKLQINTDQLVARTSAGTGEPNSGVSYSIQPVPDTIALRGSDGQLIVGTAIWEDAAVQKQQMDSALASKAELVHDHTVSQITDFPEKVNLVAGDNITIIEQDDDVIISSTGGEPADRINLQAGSGINIDESGNTLTISSDVAEIIDEAIDINTISIDVDTISKTISAGNNITIEESNDIITISSSGGGGSSIHNELTGRDINDSHPISAITGLQDFVDDVDGAVSLVAGNNITINTVGQNIEISSTGGSGGGDVSSVNGKTGVVVLNKSDIGLSNVDNTSDINKPISTATQTALNAKANTSHTHTIDQVTNLQEELSGLSGDIEAVNDELNEAITLQAGTGISISPEGIISATGEASGDADWNTLINKPAVIAAGATQAAARAAIGAGTSNLTIGTTSETAAAGNLIPSEISESEITDGVATINRGISGRRAKFIKDEAETQVITNAEDLALLPNYNSSVKQYLTHDSSGVLRWENS